MFRPAVTMPPVLALALLAGAAAGEERSCYARAGLVAHLAERFGERRIGLGHDEAAGLVELFANRETGTWTLLAVRPGGASCLVDFGTAPARVRAEMRENPV